MKKQIFLLAMMLLPVVGSAEPVLIDGIYYNLITKAKQAEVTSNANQYIGSVNIPDSVNYDGVVYSVTRIGDFAFSGCSSLTSVTIPNSVTSIEKCAFQKCSSLTYIDIPNSVTSIGEAAFQYCSGLTSITILHSVTNIGDYAFAFCSGLTSVSIPNSVTSIGYSAFANCSSLTSVTIPNSVTSLDGTFFGCSSLTSVTIPNSVTSIGEAAFQYCSGLTSVSIPGSVEYLGWNSFSNCTSLTSITIGSGVNSIGHKAFASCKELTDVYCLAENVPSTSTNAFQDSYIEYATLHVPAASINNYKAVEPWKNFKNFKTIEEQQLPKCATPTISFDKSGLVFNCETPDVEYSYEIKNTDIKKGIAEGNRVELTPVYTITYYAMKAGYENSDVATATIRWRNGSPVFQGFSRVDAGAGALWGDVNIDGQVDVSDIANIIDIMAGK